MSNPATVTEGGIILLTVRVLNGELSDPVEVSLSTFSRTAIGMCSKYYTVGSSDSNFLKMYFTRSISVSGNAPCRDGISEISRYLRTECLQNW